MKATRKRIESGRLPKDYLGLCKLFMPRRIRDRVERADAREFAEAMAGHRLASDQSDYFDLVCSLIEDDERERVSAAKVSGQEALRHLPAEHGMSGADLSRLLGAHRTLGAMILRGERMLTADHVRTRRFAFRRLR